MERSLVNKMYMVLGVFAAVLLVLAACRPVVAPGAAPREIEGPALTEEVAPFGEPEQIEAFAEAPTLGLSEEDRLISEAVTLEDTLGQRLENIFVSDIDAEFFGVEAAPLEGWFEEHMVTEFTAFTGLLIEEDLLGLEAAPVEGWFEEHMVTEFPTGVVSLDEELLSAIEETIVVEEAVPALEESLPLMEESILDEGVFGGVSAPLEGQLGEFMVTEFAAVTGLLVEQDLLGVDAALEEGWFEEHMLTEFSMGVVSLDEELLSAIEETIVAEEAVPVLEESLPLMEESILDEGVFGGVSAPLEGQIGEYMVTEFPAITGLFIEEVLLGVEAAPAEGWFEEHMVTEFSTGVVGLDDEFFSAIEGAIELEVALPMIEESLPLIEDSVVAMEEIAPVFEETYGTDAYSY